MNRVVIHDEPARIWRAYDDPVDVIQTSDPGRVARCLLDMEDRVNRERLHAVGFVSYEAARCFDDAMRVLDDDSFPLLWFGLYHGFRSITGVGESRQPVPVLPWEPSLGPAEYKERIHRIKNLIYEGETYQVNFTYRLRAPFDGDPWEYFRSLIASQQCAYGAYIGADKFTICSASPELFFRLDGCDIHSRPMKGTGHRGLTVRDDDAMRERLRLSEKDRAENVMIVDMVRNDLGRIAQPGSVNVSDLFAIERYPTLFQMVSTVTAKTDAGVSDIFGALFPAASITGAPKVRAMEIIAALEDAPRRIYTGSIGYIEPGRKAQFSVAIRTALLKQRTMEYGVGGGVVWASTVDDELDESKVKARVLSGWPVDFSLLETLRWSPDEGFFLLEYHLRRITESGRFFGYPANHEDIRRHLNESVKLLVTPHRVRLTLGRGGDMACKVAPPDLREAGPVRLRLSSKPMEINNPFLYHKTTHRSMYEDTQAAAHTCDDVLFWNARGEITETSIANIVMERDGRLITPPVSCGLLAGTFREMLIDQGKIVEEVISVEEARRAPALFTINSVRAWSRAILMTDEKATIDTQSVP